MRLFGIYNRGYNLRYVVAEEIGQALNLAAASGHIKRPAHYRRWVDLTDEPPEELAGQSKALLDSGKAGVLQQTAEGWQISA